MRHALQLIEREGGEIKGDQINIKCQRPKPVRYEQSFPNLAPKERIRIGQNLANEYAFTADCAGIAIRGEAKSNNPDYVALVEISIDGKVAQVSEVPAKWQVRKLEIFWDFTLKQCKHEVSLRWLNPQEGASVWMNDALLLQKTR
jgi:hypothetical protein